MSWFSENYEKTALGGAAIVAIAVGGLIWSGNNQLSDAFDVNEGKRNNDASVAGFEVLKKAFTSFENKHTVQTSSIKGREVGLFTSVPLFVEKSNASKLMDLYGGAPLHEGIENSFWLKYGVDPSYDNSPKLDEDEDGFSNAEEYVGKTDPTKFSSHPDAVLKLAVGKVDVLQIHVKPTDAGQGKALFRLEDGKKKTYNRMRTPIDPGQAITFDKAVMKNRFKFVGVEEVKNAKGFNEKLWIVEDLKKNKAGLTYRFTRKGDFLNDRDRKDGIKDVTVTFDLKALKESGKEFQLEENTRFSLPFDKKANDKPYLFKSVDLKKKSVEIEYAGPDGKVTSHIINY